MDKFSRFKTVKEIHAPTWLLLSLYHYGFWFHVIKDLTSSWHSSIMRIWIFLVLSLLGWFHLNNGKRQEIHRQTGDWMPRNILLVTVKGHIWQPHQDLAIIVMSSWLQDWILKRAKRIQGKVLIFNYGAMKDSKNCDHENLQQRGCPKDRQMDKSKSPWHVHSVDTLPRHQEIVAFVEIF